MSNFFRRGTSKIYWVPTIASAGHVPTAAEVTAGTDLSPKVNAIDGFTFENAPIETENLSESFTPTIPGPDTVAKSKLTFNEDKSTNTIRTTLAKGTAGYIVIFFAGIAGSSPAAADKCDVWPVIVTGHPRLYDMGAVQAKYDVGFTPTATPAEDVAVT